MNIYQGNVSGMTLVEKRPFSNFIMPPRITDSINSQSSNSHIRIIGLSGGVIPEVCICSFIYFNLIWSIFFGLSMTMYTIFLKNIRQRMPEPRIVVSMLEGESRQTHYLVYSRLVVPQAISSTFKPS